MDRLAAMRVFMRVAENKSFVSAARALGMPPSTVTGIVKRLEQHLSVRLIQRTTRRIALTNDGERYYEDCRTILHALDAAEQRLKADTPQGRLRVDMPAAIGRALVIPALPAFNRAYPDIDMALSLNDRNIDLIEQGVDCVIRAGTLPDSTLIARKLGDLTWITCAAPGYLSRYGTPRSSGQLGTHRAIQYFNLQPERNTRLRFSNDVSVEVQTSISVNETEAYIHFALMGYGMVQLSEQVVRPYLHTGQLVELLADERPAPVPIALLYPHRRQLSPAMKAFSTWLSQLCERSL